jgi:large subunit ribosomal protein L25
MAERTLDIQEREGTGKEVAKKMRRNGCIPAVLYGHRGNKNLLIKAVDFLSLFEEIGEHSIITLNIDNKENAEVPIVIEGTSKGVKKGGVLETLLRDIEIECLPKDIPDNIIVNIEDMDINDSLHVKELKFDDKITILANPEQVVITIGTPSIIIAPVEEIEEVPVEEEALEEGETSEEEEEKAE